MPWEKGKSGNPTGRPPIAKPVQKLRKASRDKIAQLCDKLTKAPISYVKEVYDNPKSSSLEVMLSGVILKAALEKDHISLNALMDRMVGKVKDIQDYSFRNVGKPSETMPTGSEMLSSAIKLASGQLIALQVKASHGVELSEVEQRSIATLSKTVIELNDAESRLRSGSSLTQLSDKELAKLADKAKATITKTATTPNTKGSDTIN
jgi:hypothetical protein